MDIRRPKEGWLVDPRIGNEWNSVWSFLSFSLPATPERLSECCRKRQLELTFVRPRISKHRRWHGQPIQIPKWKRNMRSRKKNWTRKPKYWLSGYPIANILLHLPGLAYRHRPVCDLSNISGNVMWKCSGIPDFRGPEGVWTLRAEGRVRTRPTTSSTSEIGSNFEENFPIFHTMHYSIPKHDFPKFSPILEIWGQAFSKNTVDRFSRRYVEDIIGHMHRNFRWNFRVYCVWILSLFFSSSGDSNIEPHEFSTASKQR